LKWEARMIYPFNASEAFKIAVALEENGLKFYTEAAKKFSSKPIGEIFLSLAKEEEIHKATFSSYLASLPTDQPSVFDPNNEIDEYLKMLADLNVFKNGAQQVEDLLAKVKTPTDAILLAIEMEKDSVVFYVQLKNATESLSDRASLDSIILEEARHIRKLARIINTTK
jgi:rubrerythrin